MTRYVSKFAQSFLTSQSTFVCGHRDSASSIWITNAGCHPDGDQAFWPIDGGSMIVVLSKHRDESTLDPTTFAAFYLDGTVGIRILAGVYHVVAFPIFAANHVTTAMRSKQRSVIWKHSHICNLYVAGACQC
jgi:ureidoglycolate hydrolase